MRGSVRRALYLAVGVAALVVVGTPGLVDAHSRAAAAVHQPDASVRYLGAASSSFGRYLAPSRWHGRGTFNTSAESQTSSQKLAGTAPRGARYIYEVVVKNDGASDQFALTATGHGSWRVRYLVGTLDITPSVLAGTYRTPTLATGDKVVITVKVWLGRPGTRETRLLTASSVADSSRQDSVKVAVRYAACGC